MEDDLDDFIEWLRVLGLPEADFRKHIRGYFDDTTEMEEYIEARRDDIHYMSDTYVGESVPYMVTRVPTEPHVTIEDTVPIKTGHYKGKRRKR